MILLKDLWMQAHYKDAIDIIIVAFLLYQLLQIIKGTRAVQMLLGIGALSILFWLGQRYELYSLNWLLSHIFDSMILILIIIFQDQLKSAFASIGSGGSLWGAKGSEDQDKHINELVDLCSMLQKQKIGALIVLERANGLENYANSGSVINAIVHSDLLYSIFQIKSPLHDGAVIISKGKIRAAGCFLPLSKEVGIDKSFGTRHRAALGISESTDAIAITVSEETGKLHVCIGGQFKFCSDSHELGRYLKRVWEGDSGVTALEVAG